MQIDADLTWDATCLRKERVLLTLRDNAGHSASIELPPTDALRLAGVLTGEMHGSSPDVWLVERLARADRLWLTLSSTSRGMVRISRIELSDACAESLSHSLSAAALACHPELSSLQQLRRSLLKPLRAALRWGVLHTRPLTRPHQLWMTRFHRSMVALYRTLANFERAVPTRSH
jgi:hypothetical protein